MPTDSVASSSRPPQIRAPLAVAPSVTTLGGRLLNAALKQLGCETQVRRESICKEAQRLYQELLGPHPRRMERLFAQRVVLAYLHLVAAEEQVARSASWEDSSAIQFAHTNRDKALREYGCSLRELQHLQQNAKKSKKAPTAQKLRPTY